MKETLEAINRMQADGIIGKYAIGGAVGATFYLEPIATVDLDVFVLLPGSPGGLISLEEIYGYLKTRGGQAEDEYIVIGGWPVQFLAPHNNLEQEAITEAVTATVEGVRTTVMTPEHLVAIALQTGRSKDYIRILQFMEQAAVDRLKLNPLLNRHGLIEKWQRFGQKFMEGRHE